MATMINIKCKECGEFFVVKLGKEKMFCTKNCKLNNRHKLDEIYYIEKNCECCGKLFKSKIKENKKYCSYKCSGQNKKNVSREERTCLKCNTKFTERIKHERKFCSDKCRKEWQIMPENIEERMTRVKESVFKKYGVQNTFQVDSIRLLAIENMKKTYKLNGVEISKNNLQKIEDNRQKKLVERFDNIGYIVLEFNNKNIKIQHPDGHIFENNSAVLYQLSYSRI